MIMSSLFEMCNIHFKQAAHYVRVGGKNIDALGLKINEILRIHSFKQLWAKRLFSLFQYTYKTLSLF